MTLRADIIEDVDSILEDWDDVIWSGITYKGIFHNEYEQALEGIETQDPWIEVKEADFSAITHSATVIVNSVTYHVIGIEPGAMGLMKLKLSKDA